MMFLLFFPSNSTLSLLCILKIGNQEERKRRQTSGGGGERGKGRCRKSCSILFVRTVAIDCQKYSEKFPYSNPLPSSSLPHHHHPSPSLPLFLSFSVCLFFSFSFRLLMLFVHLFQCFLVSLLIKVRMDNALSSVLLPNSSSSSFYYRHPVGRKIVLPPSKRNLAYVRER